MNLLLKVSDLRYSYPGNPPLEVLSGLSLELNPGETIAIMGPSGCGKSTLISCLAGLVKPEEGEILVLNQNILKLKGDELTLYRASHIGIIFQQFHLIDQLTALENVMLPLELRGEKPSRAMALSREVLEQMGMGSRLDHFPHQLSRGENQRVAIARVLVGRPQLLLADEPTASLDRRSALESMHHLLTQCRRLNAGLIVVTHDPEIASLCSRQLQFHQGKLYPS